MPNDRDYIQAKVGIQENAERAFTKSDGYQNFDDQDFSGAQMKNLLLSPFTITEIVSADSILTVSGNLSPAYGHFLFSAATAVSKASARLPVAVPGATLWLNFAGFAGDANISLIASGVSCNTLNGSDLSSFEISAAGFVKLVCESGTLWQVVEANASVTQNASA